MNEWVIIAKKTGCPGCDQLKSWLVSHGIDIKIKYAEDCMPFCRENQIKTVPTLIANTRVVGFDEITKFLES